MKICVLGFGVVLGSHIGPKGYLFGSFREPFGCICRCFFPCVFRRCFWEGFGENLVQNHPQMSPNNSYARHLFGPKYIQEFTLAILCSCSAFGSLFVPFWLPKWSQHWSKSVFWASRMQPKSFPIRLSGSGPEPPRTFQDIPSTSVFFKTPGSKRRAAVSRRRRL